MFDFLTIEFVEVAAIMALAAAACSLLGCFLVLRRMALLTDAIGHVLLLGIVIAFLILKDLESIWLVLAAALSGLATVSMVEAISRSKLVKEDAAIGLVFPAFFALGILLASMYARNTHLDIDRVLLGHVVFAPLDRIVFNDYDLGPRSAILLLGMLLWNTLFVGLFFKELKLSTFDAGLATTLGFLPLLLHYLLMGSTSLTIVLAFDAVGPVLVVAFFVLPAASAYLLTDRLGRMIALSVLIGVFGSVLGTAIAFAFDATVAGTAAVTLGGLFLLAWIFSPTHGLVVQAWQHRQQHREFFDRLLAIHLAQHEGTAEELAECRLATLGEHFNWPSGAANLVAQRVIQRGWGYLDGETLKLTSEGRGAAQITSPF
jgi:manganese/zinc/iron transport system permease protein